jgi:hypothetical protein
MPRRPPATAKRDGNELAIVEALTYAGASVERLSQSGVPDLLVGKHGHNLLLEVKTEKGKLTDPQITWHAEWGGSVQIVQSIEQALDALNATAPDTFLVFVGAIPNPYPLGRGVYGDEQIARDVAAGLLGYGTVQWVEVLQLVDSKLRVVLQLTK